MIIQVYSLCITETAKNMIPTGINLILYLILLDWDCAGDDDVNVFEAKFFRKLLNEYNF